MKNLVKQGLSAIKDFENYLLMVIWNKNLSENDNLSNYTINRMNWEDNITTDMLVKICPALIYLFDDIMEMVPD